MRSFEIPEILHKEFSGKGNSLAVNGFPNAEIVYGEPYPSVFLKVFLEGHKRAKKEGDSPDFKITVVAGPPWIKTDFELLEQSPFKEIAARAMELYKQSEDYTDDRFVRFPRT